MKLAELARVELVNSDSSTVPALGGDSWSNTEFVYRFVGGRSYAYRHDRLVDGSQAYRRDSCQEIWLWRKNCTLKICTPA